LLLILLQSVFNLCPLEIQQHHRCFQFYLSPWLTGEIYEGGKYSA